MGRFDYIARMIQTVRSDNTSHYDYRTHLDRVNFEKYCGKAITLSECIDRFKNNHEVKGDIVPEDFKDWLASVGYRRDDE